ncbi:MAG: hypothetical protein ACO3WN_07500 [Burkholderiaceae bacterium]
MPEKRNEPAKKMGRPSKYSPELVKEICERLADGEPLRQICRDAHMPAWSQIYEWMAKDDALGANGSGLSLSIAKAREMGQDAIAEEIYREVMQEPERILSEGGSRIDSGYVQLLKARADIKLKLLAKWNPKRYGDRVQVAGDAENPLKTETTIQASELFMNILQNMELKKQQASNE